MHAGVSTAWLGRLLGHGHRRQACSLAVSQLQALLCMFAQQGDTLQEGQLLLLLLLHAGPEGLQQPHLQAGRRRLVEALWGLPPLCAGK